jgi:SAM-dependent methyltransferase
VPCASSRVCGGRMRKTTDMSNAGLDRWEQRFAAEGYLFGTEPSAFLSSQAHRLTPGGQALAVADGEGRNGVWLAEHGLGVLSVDFSPTALAKARQLAARRGIALQTAQADLVTWDWPDEAFDVVVAIFIQFAAPDDRNRIFAGIKQSLKQGGLLLMQGYRPEQLRYGTGGPPEIERLYIRALLERAFANFSELEITEHDSSIAEGTAHVGMSALIDLVARK